MSFKPSPLGICPKCNRPEIQKLCGESMYPELVGICTRCYQKLLQGGNMTKRWKAWKRLEEASLRVANNATPNPMGIQALNAEKIPAAVQQITARW